MYKVLDYYEKKPSVHLIMELLWTRYAFDGVYQQYFQYAFENKTIEERMKYVGSFEVTNFVLGAGTKNGKRLLNNKYDSYEKFKKYYHREIIKVEKQEDILDFSSFCQKHKRFIVKPLKLNGGKGIKIYDIEKQNSMQVFTQILSMGGVVCEELICQSEEMANYHPQSVNTVRVVTYLENNQFTPIFAMLRMGSGDSNVDNTTAGGICASIDLKTGKIASQGLIRMNKNYVSFEKHPDTNVQIIGSFVPRWQELIDMLKSLANVLPEQKCVGWDLALTEEGWIMVEGNPNPLFSTIQILEQRGYRDIIESLKNK